MLGEPCWFAAIQCWFVVALERVTLLDSLGNAGPLSLSRATSGGKINVSMCYTEKAPNAWHRRGTQKT